MTATTRYETVAADNGEFFKVFCALPEGSGGRPGVMLFQEILGINDNMRAIAQQLADAGYLTVVPDMFWRIEPRFERQDESGMADGLVVVQQFDFQKAALDIQATHAHLLGMSACSGKVGAIGFCLGRGLAFLAATSSRVRGRGPDAVVCYYGSPINSMLDNVESLECPAQFHYGEHDDFISASSIDAVQEAVAGQPGVEFYRYDAGHAFSNWDAPSFYVEAAAREAWPRSIDFLKRYLS